MWNVKGTLPLFLSIFGTTFAVMGHFVFTQKVLSTHYEGGELLFWSAWFQAFYLLPFIYMIVPASFFSNRFPKNRVLAWTSVVITASFIATGIFYTLKFYNLAIFFTLLTASAFAVHSPAKYGILKEMYGTKQLGFANAVLQIISVIALALAALLVPGLDSVESAFEGSLTVKEFLGKTVAWPWIFMGISALSTVAAFFVPSVRRGYASARRSSVFRNLAHTWKIPTVRACMVGISIFWIGVQIFVMVFQQQASASNETIALFKNGIFFAVIGLLLGSLIVARASREFIETGLVPMGALGSSICLVIVPFLSSQVAIDIAFFLVGTFSGMFLVTLNALLQFNTAPTNSGRILAVSNLIQIVLLGAFLGLETIVLHNVQKFFPEYQSWIFPGFFIAFAILSFIGFAYSLKHLPQALLRSLLRTFFSPYKLKVMGLQNIPDEGPVLLLGNHFSFIDWAVLQMATPRPLRIASNKDHFEKWYLRCILKRMGIIRIHKKNTAEAMEKIHEALKNGEAVVLFPEGEIAKTPFIGPFRVDYSQAIQDTETVIVPFYIQGLWGSRYAYSNDTHLFGPTLTRIITVAFGEPLPKETEPNKIRNIVREISIDAWSNSLKYYKPIASSWLYACKRVVRSGPSIYSPEGAHFSGYKLLCATLAFSRVFKKRLAGQKHVGIMLPPSAGGIIANLAGWVRGKINVNLNYTSAPDIVEKCIERAEIKTIITSRVFLERLKQKGTDYSVLSQVCELIYAEDVLKSIPKSAMIFHMFMGILLPVKLIEFFYFKKVKLSDTAAILFSSGTEGTPKGVELTHYNMVGNCQQLSCVYNANKSDVMLAELPLFHSFGLTVNVLLCLLEGIPIVVVADPTDVKTMARVCAEFHVTAFVGTPTFLRAFTVNRWVHPMCFKYLRLIIAGAEKLRPEISTAFRLKFGKEIFEGYGCTETAPVASVNLDNILLDDYLTMQVNNKPGTVGMPLCGTLYKIVDPDTNQELPIGEDGMILIGGCQVMKGYLKDSEHTKNAIIEMDGRRWYRTGDKGHLDEDGFLTIVDRYSRFAKLGGEMISLGAVEIRINETKILEGFDYMVTTIPDSAKGECVVLLYSGAEMEPADVLRALRKSGIPPLMVPGLAFKVPQIPKLGTGKADFKASKKLALELANA
ncbi:MAG: MFS transporter [Hallerella porci]|uniref:Acyl-[acyl-carrier-protein]-phospholipid O-acyltransferase/long-chain-fatty-acid--[acyl-carrier-protein] ligase n=1 Tax=Hallerella porci TaxID=1945871 RepID=A0ABX5LJP6_9BACT|nr:MULTISPECIES: MFS transporter [Hallerella]MCI5599729.1 MFS transporter [Hallerella sp.]MDY3922429.1 MFS transporter [Hallerella porci]PWK94481.1 acyl-[acyl-carrier-protein]-phospholipid O-acyltransferase/long-chain-fatty-acid--[acyl-carrier-protein] ligase [Hallerella porci]